MLKQFYVSFEDLKFDSFALKHIQYNVQKHIGKLKYITYRRIDIMLSCLPINGSEIEWDDKRSSKIRMPVTESMASNVKQMDVIAAIYDIIFRAISDLWKKNNWNVEDLKDAQSKIEKDRYISVIFWGGSMYLRIKIVNPIYFADYFRPLDISIQECQQFLDAFKEGISQTERLQLLGFK
jgi:hypothetical protein